MKIPYRKTLQHMGSEKGFSLIEVLVALTILTIGILSVNAMQTLAIRGNQTAQGITTASNWGADRAERIFGLSYDDALLNETVVDGVGDPNADPKTGLYADLVGTADQNWTSPDGNYTVLWNIVEDFPMPNVKTIHVIVNRNDRGFNRSTTFRYMKPKYM